MSGSGKSSLAFDTLYAEGQRRYVESFSAYARQFLERMDKPQVERVEGIPPAIAIDQSNPIKNSRSTVGTMTELTDHIRLLFAKIGQLHCQQCGRPVQRSHAGSIVTSLLQHAAGQAIMIAFPYTRTGSQTSEAIRVELQRLGFTRLLVAGQVVRLDAEVPCQRPRRLSRCWWTASWCRQTGARACWIRSNRRYALGRAWSLCTFQMGSSRSSASTCIVRIVISPTVILCQTCSPSTAPWGCEVCQGFGRTIGLDMDLVIPDPRKTLAQGAIKPWSGPSTTYERRMLMAFCARHGIPTDVPFAQLTAAQRQALCDGDGGEYEGIRGWFAWLETRTYRMHIRIFLARFRSYVTCAGCHGGRLKAEALLTRIRGKDITQIYAMSVGDTYTFFRDLTEAYRHDQAISLLLGEIVSRLQYMVDVGLDYLTLDRQSRTLWGRGAARQSDHGAGVFAGQHSVHPG